MAVKETSLSQKLRGGYYTSEPISNFLANWAITDSNNKILEPSCGDGNILVAAINTLKSLGAAEDEIAQQVLGVEFDKNESIKSWERIRDLGIPINLTQIHSGDFFEHCKNQLLKQEKFDAVIGNPPFIRYQDFLKEHKDIAFELMEKEGFKPNRLTNSWVPFLVISSFLLNDNGRLGMVIPAELFQVNYAAETRKFLSEYFSKITIVSFEKLLWTDAQQEVILLLCEKHSETKEGIKVVELHDEEDLINFDFKSLDKNEVKPINHSKDKWTQYFLSEEEILFLRELRERDDIPKSSEVIDVDVGIVTGQNKYFLLTEEQISQMGIKSQDLKPLVGRSSHLKGTIFSNRDWEENYYSQLPANMFSPPDLPLEELTENLQEYIRYGESIEVHKGYKCRIRKRWYIVPSVWVPDAFMLRQVHSYPKLVLNNAKATCTDTIHRVRFINNVEGELVTAAFLNTITFAFSEITGRSYGGGVLTFEPSEAENLPFPLINAEKLDLIKIDELLRNNEIEAVLNITDEVILKQGLGLNDKEIKMLRNIWMKLRDRRINRKRKSKSKS